MEAVRVPLVVPVRVAPEPAVTDVHLLDRHLELDLIARRKVERHPLRFGIGRENDAFGRRRGHGGRHRCAQRQGGEHQQRQHAAAHASRLYLSRPRGYGVKSLLTALLGLFRRS